MKRIDPRDIPEERGALVPPRRRPPTAVGTATPQPEDDDAEWVAHRQARLRRGSLLGQALTAMGRALRDLFAGRRRERVPAGGVVQLGDDRGYHDGYIDEDGPEPWRG